MEFYERISGARMHAAYHRPHTNFRPDIDYSLLADILSFVQTCYITLNEMHNVLTYNKIWKQRLINIGTLSSYDCKNYSLTGVLLRSAGVARDIRLSFTESYSSYNNLNFRSFLGSNGDTYDRYLIRMLEMGESLMLINIVCLYLCKVKYKAQSTGAFFRSNATPLQPTLAYSSMEDLITHFVN